MDFSLLQPHSHHPFLRDVTALKYRWPYYLIMVLDPLLRFNWVFYAIFTHDAQHSSIASFLIGFAEVTRRGMWTLLRVENEHCANVKQYKASRDVPLPYHLDADAASSTSSHDAADADAAASRPSPSRDDDLVRSPSAARVSWTGAVAARTRSGGRSTAVDLPSPGPRGQQHSPSDSSAVGGGGELDEEGGRTPGEESFRMRRRRADTIGRKSIRAVLADAHKQDFEKKRKPEAGRGGRADDTGRVGEVEEEDDDDDDDDEDEDLVASEEVSDEETVSMEDERMEIREAEMLSRQARDRNND